MRYWTYGEIRSKVREDLGIEQEDFITANELLGYANMAIDDAESHIHTIYEDYFLTESEIDITLGQSDYSLPSNIYANKIRSLIYVADSDVYTIKRHRNISDVFENIEYDKQSSVSDFMYYLTNSSAEEGVKLRLTPTPKNGNIDVAKLYYIRNANRMVDDTSLCDIPEFTDYVIQFMKVRCYEKELHPNLQASIQILDYKRTTMIDTLSTMVPDGDNMLDQDQSIYWEMGEGIEHNYY